MQLINKKQDTAGNWTPSQQSRECHHRSLLLFCCCCKGKSKTWRNNTEVCSSRKRKPLHTWPLHYPVTTRGFLGHEAETRRWDIRFPHSPAFPTALNWHNDFHHLFIHIKRHDTSIPGDTQSLFSFAIRQDSRIKGIAKAFSCLFCSCNGKRQTI